MNQTISQNRNSQLDFVRVFCVLWIVGFWHLQNYVSETFQLKGEVLDLCRNITKVVLACFTFLSGYFLSKYNFSSVSDIVFFFKKRFGRFFILFFSSVLSMFLMRGCNLSQSFFAICGASLFTSNPIPTLWYFSMLILFYLLTPIFKIKFNENSMNVQIVIIVILFVLFILFADRRLYLYLPFYVVGLNLSKNNFESFMNKKTMVLTAIVLIAFINFLKMHSLIFEYLFLICGVTFLLSCGYVVYRPKTNLIITRLAYSSMCAYLFHRQFYKFTIILMKFFDDNMSFLPLPIALLSVALLFLISYYIQKFYDRYVRQIN